jgi:hypothetical protein
MIATSDNSRAEMDKRVEHRPKGVQKCTDLCANLGQGMLAVTKSEQLA